MEQAGDQQFVWQYYDDVFSDIRAAGLKIIPIMAFHQCGGNVGDDCDIPLPGWIWTHYQRKGIAPDNLRYQSIATLNPGWGTAYKNFAEIALPVSWDQAIASNQYLVEPSRQDFLQWYHQALVAHGARMLRYAEYAFQQLPAEIPLGFKIPGIHWTINSDIGARTAELAAGIIDANAAFSSTPEPGYQQIIALAAPKAKQQRKVVVHFTALEMSDEPEGEAGSMPSTLVNWIGAEARRQGVILKGENALAAGLYHAEGWSNLQQVLRNGNYQGLTLLRLNDIVENPLAVATLQQLQPGF